MIEAAGRWSGALVTTAGGPVFVRHTPGPSAGEPALFVHGLGGESLDWADVALLLADRLDAFALDLPGFGQSPPLPGDYSSLDAHVRVVVEVIRAMDRGAVHLIGNSLGGAVATRVAAEYPQLVRSLVLISPALPDLRPRLWSWQLLVALIPGLGTRVVTAALRGDPGRMARRVLWLCYGNPSSVSDRRRNELVDAATRRARLSHSGQVYQASLRALVSSYLQFGRRRLWRQARAVRVPTLLIYGGRDKLVDPRLARRAAATFRDTRVLLIPEAGHVAHLEFPDRVAGPLREFLDRSSPPLSPGMGGRHGTVEGSDAPVSGAPDRRPP